MHKDSFDYENLRSQTLTLLEKCKSTKNKNTIYEKVSHLWKNIPTPVIRKDSDLKLSKYKYKYSTETTMYLIIYHLFSTGNQDIVNTFLEEYTGNQKEYLKTCINNYSEFTWYINMIQEGDYTCLDKFVTQMGVSDEIIFYYSMYKFVTEVDELKSIQDLKKNTKLIIKKYSEESKKYLKNLIIKNNHKEELSHKLKTLFIKEYCKIKDFVDGDYLPLLFDQGGQAFDCLLENNYTFKDNEDQNLPVEIKLEKNRQFHSLFVCPVIKEVCVDNDSPVLLECNHVISSSASNVLSKFGASAVFKCPYCPKMTRNSKLVKLELY